MDDRATIKRVGRVYTADDGRVAIDGWGFDGDERWAPPADAHVVSPGTFFGHDDDGEPTCFGWPVSELAELSIRLGEGAEL